MKRPAVIIGLLFMSGILAGKFFPFPPIPLLVVSLGLAVVGVAWSQGRAFLLYLLLPAAGFVNFGVRTAALSPRDLRRLLPEQPELVTLRGKLAETPTFRVYEMDEKPSWRTMARLDVTGLQINRQSWQPAIGRMAVTTPGMLTNFFAGQTVEITGVSRTPRGPIAEGTFDYRTYLNQKGIYFQLQAGSEQDWHIVASPAMPPLADRFRAWGRRALALGLPVEDESLRLEWALTLGWKTAMTEEVSEPFIRAATYHIFAVDGLRMAIIFGIFFGLLRALGIPRGICGAVLIPLIWFYTALTGWPASAIRATVMLTVVIAGWILKRPGELINSLFAAGLIILIWEPQQLFQAGFQLSFLVVLCLILTVPVLHRWLERVFAPDPLLPARLYPRWRRWARVPGRYLGDLLVTSLAAWIGSLPLVAYYFHIVTPVSTPANILAVPLCGLVLVSNLGALLLAGWFPAAAVLFNHAGWFLMECIRVSSQWFAKWTWAYFYVPAPGIETSTLYYAVLLAALTGWLFKEKVRRWNLAALTLGISLWAWHGWAEHRTTRLTILPVNGGMTIHFDAPGRKSDLLIDCGRTNSVQFITKPFLRAQGVNRLETLVLTHGDVSHVGGAETVVDLFAVRTVCVSAVRFRSPIYRQIIRDLGDTPDRLRIINRGEAIGKWQVLHPGGSDHFPQADDNAVVILGIFGGMRVLLLSDLGRPGQNALLERLPDLRADIVVTGLPAQPEAVCDALLDRLQPRVLIVADSEHPASERASRRLCERLARRPFPVIYTREEGAATIELGKSGWEIRTMSGMRLSKKGPPG